VTIFCEKVIEFLENCNKFFSSGLLFLFLDPGAGMGKNLDPVSGINIQDPPHCSILFPKY
jgi:hypothetical protein